MNETEYDVYKDEDGFYYSDGVLAENGDYYMVHIPPTTLTQWKCVFPIDHLHGPSKKIGYIIIGE